MFDSAPQLLLTCTLMFLGALAAGYLPYLLQVSDSSMLAVSTVGAGLLIGTALGVVCPEGFAHTTTCKGHEDHLAHIAGTSQHLHRSLLEDEEDVEGPNGHTHTHHDRNAQAAQGFPALYTDVCVPPWLTGFVLAMGFMCMLIIEVLQHKFAHAHHVKGRSSPPLTMGSQDALHKWDSLEEGPRPQRNMTGEPDRGNSALLGLVIHAAADGFAVGAASMSPSTKLAFLIGAAMVLHKGPVAFGLTTFLMRCNWTWAQVMQGMLVFSSASPVVAILTYLVLRHVPHLTTPSNIGLCVIFSAGTFIYAACMHILPTVINPHNTSFKSLGLLSLGVMLPLFFNMGHSHAHH